MQTAQIIRKIEGQMGEGKVAEHSMQSETNTIMFTINYCKKCLAISRECTHI